MVFSPAPVSGIGIDEYPYYCYILLIIDLYSILVIIDVVLKKNVGKVASKTENRFEIEQKKPFSS